MEDATNPEPRSIDLVAIYGFLVPNENASNGPGTWQTFDITLVGRRVTVVLNGKTIICDQTIPGITGGALDSDEGAPGPICLQGDHGAVQYRNLRITPAVNVVKYPGRGLPPSPGLRCARTPSDPIAHGPGRRFGMFPKAPIVLPGGVPVHDSRPSLVQRDEQGCGP